MRKVLDRRATYRVDGVTDRRANGCPVSLLKERFLGPRVVGQYDFVHSGRETRSHRKTEDCVSFGSGMLVTALHGTRDASVAGNSILTLVGKALVVSLGMIRLHGLRSNGVLTRRCLWDPRIAGGRTKIATFTSKPSNSRKVTCPHDLHLRSRYPLRDSK